MIRVYEPKRTEKTRRFWDVRASLEEFRALATSWSDEDIIVARAEISDEIRDLKDRIHAGESSSRAHMARRWLAMKMSVVEREIARRATSDDKSLAESIVLELLEVFDRSSPVAVSQTKILRNTRGLLLQWIRSRVKQVVPGGDS